MLAPFSADITLRPLLAEDCVTLSDACNTWYQHADDDRFRRREWPFPDRQAALQHGLALELSRPPADGLSAAWTVWESDPKYCSGLLALTQMDPKSRTALLGTYITPSRRGFGLQLTAKRILFDITKHVVRHYICFIADDNESSLRSIARCAEVATVIRFPSSSLPNVLFEEWWRQGQPQHIFRLTPYP